MVLLKARAITLKVSFIYQREKIMLNLPKFFWMRLPVFNKLTNWIDYQEPPKQEEER